METLKLIIKLWPLLSAVIAAIAIAAVALYQIRQNNATLAEHSKTLKDLSDIDKVVRTRLYLQDGTTIFMPRVDCDRCRAQCHAQLVERYDNIEKLFTTRFDSLEKLIEKNKG